jgi:hypothetical protein
VTNADEYGLISAEHYQHEEQRIQEHYRRAAEAENKIAWNFEEKPFESERNR